MRFVKTIRNIIIRREGSSLVSILIAFLIVGILFWMLVKTQQRNKGQSEIMEGVKIDTSSYKSTLDSARRIAEDASKLRQ